MNFMRIQDYLFSPFFRHKTQILRVKVTVFGRLENRRQVLEYSSWHKEPQRYCDVWHIVYRVLTLQ